MVDPAVAYQSYPPFEDGKAMGAFLKNSSGGVYQGTLTSVFSNLPNFEL